MRYVYYKGCIISSPYKAIRFTKVPGTGILEKVYVANERITEVRYSRDISWDMLPDVMVMDESSSGLIDFVGDLQLYPRHSINGLNFTIRYKPNCCRLWSCFIDYKETEVKYEENEIGGWLIIPYAKIDEIFVPDERQRDINIQKFTSEIVAMMDSKSELFYITGTKFKISNIQAVDMLEENVREDWDDVRPYSNYQDLYLTEADIIAAFIRECKKNFPEIEFFPQSSERKNLGRETIYYKSALSQNRSVKFSSNLIESPFDGRYFQTTIPIELYYQTADIKQYVHRRDRYLICEFLMNIHEFKVTKKRWYKDRYGNDTEEFLYSTFWERDTVQNDLVKADANDGSGRDTYTLTMLCDLIGFVIESSDTAPMINEVITNIYFNGMYSYSNITR